MINTSYVYKLSHSEITQCISVDKIIRCEDDESGLVSHSEPHTCAFTPLQKAELATYLDGGCDCYLSAMDAIWTQDVIDAYSNAHSE